MITNTGVIYSKDIIDDNNITVNDKIRLNGETGKIEVYKLIHPLNEQYGWINIVGDYSINSNTGNRGEIFNNYEQNSALYLYSHAEGNTTHANNQSAHAEGAGTTAGGVASHAEGCNTTTTLPNISDSSYSHAEGFYTTAAGISSHAEGYNTRAGSNYSHAGGIGTQTYTEAGTVIGKYNIYQQTNNNNTTSNITDHLFVIGNGSDTDHRSNAFVVDTSGNINISGNLTLNNTKQIQIGNFIITSSVDSNTSTLTIE